MIKLIYGIWLSVALTAAYDVIAKVPSESPLTPVASKYSFEQTIAILDVVPKGAVLYQMSEDHGMKAGTVVPIDFTSLYRRIAKYRDHFSEQQAQFIHNKAYLHELRFISPRHAQIIHLGEGWLEISGRYALMSTEDYNFVRQLLVNRQKEESVLTKEVSELVQTLRDDYADLDQVMPFSKDKETQNKKFNRELNTPAEKAVFIEANTIELVDAQAVKKNEARNSLLNTPSKPAVKNNMNQPSVKKVDKLVVRDQAPRREDQTVYAKLADGGKFVDKRTNKSMAKGGEVGNGVSARLLQWVYSGAGILVFFVFVYVLNKYANKHR